MLPPAGMGSEIATAKVYTVVISNSKTGLASRKWTAINAQRKLID
jgi:hypothetical protein